MRLTTINKQLFDDLIKQQIGVGRYAGQQAADMVDLLKLADADITAKILKWGESPRYTPARLKALLAEIKLMIADVYGEASDTLRNEMAAFAEHAAEAAAATIAIEAPLAWKPFGISKEQLAAILDTTPIRIGVNQSLLFDEIFKGIAAGKEEKIRGAIRLSMVEGESVHQAVNRLVGTAANGFKDGVFHGSRRDLANITHTVIQHTNNRAVQALYQNNSEVLNGWIYMATLDSNTCSYCFSRSGKKYKLGEGQEPPLHVNCRCFAAPDVKTWRELGYDKDELATSTRASSSGQVKSDISFNDWLKGESPKTQRELLGPVRAKMFAEGKLTLDKFTDNSGRLYTLEQLKKS